MTGKPTAVFLVNLVQDVNILRPLVFLATRDFGFRALFLVSAKFQGRDLFGIWQTELATICAETGAELVVFEDDWQALRQLDSHGVIFAASESNLPAHITTHNVFRYAPPEYLKVTLQHGFECIGFRHSADHVKAHGTTAGFAADIVCGWYDHERLVSMAASQRAKLVVTGPSALLQQVSRPAEATRAAEGIVCENLHSVRLNVAGDFKSEFVDVFAEYCGMLAEKQGSVVLRPHPGGQYVLKNNVPLPGNARIDNAPMYRLDLGRFAYGISAPSSVLIDMLLAKIPTAVWRDRDGGMDTSTYDGITSVCTPREWLDFAREATDDPQPFLAMQRDFLKSLGMPLDPAEVYNRFAEIFRAVRRSSGAVSRGTVERDRILFVANSNVPTLQLSFEKPLAPLVARGEIVTGLLTEQMIFADPGRARDPAAQREFVRQQVARFDPALVVFCRYSGPASDAILDWTRAENVPVLYHIDDDLLQIPADIGERKFALHNAPARLEAVRTLLNAADLVYASTEKLKNRLTGYFPDLPLRAGQIYCSSMVMRRPRLGAARKVGYMASADHAHNLDMILPAVIQLLERNPHVGFEFFGSIPIPQQLLRFGERITTAPPIANYGAFLEEFARYDWDVGICPLTPIDFNMMKANTKWVEYTAVGAAVVASRGTVYDGCCGDGCGILAETAEEWLAGLELLVNDDAARLAQVERAQRKLEEDYSIARLRDQVIDIMADCRKRAASRQMVGANQKETSLVR